MTTQISVETLSPITHNQIPVITTELLAQLYGTEPVRIRQNHHENKVRFVEGKHFFKVVGNDLKELRVALNYSQNLRVTLSNSQNLQPSLRGLQISRKPAPSFSGQNAEQPVMQKCSKPIRRGRCSKNWKTAISASARKILANKRRSSTGFPQKKQTALYGCGIMPTAHRHCSVSCIPH